MWAPFLRRRSRRGRRHYTHLVVAAALGSVTDCIKGTNRPSWSLCEEEVDVVTHLFGIQRLGEHHTPTSLPIDEVNRGGVTDRVRLRRQLAQRVQRPARLGDRSKVVRRPDPLKQFAVADKERPVIRVIPTFQLLTGFLDRIAFGIDADGHDFDFGNRVAQRIVDAVELGCDDGAHVGAIGIHERQDDDLAAEVS